MTAAERKAFMDCSPAFSSQHTTTRTATASTLEARWPSRHNRSDLQDFGDCIQSSQIGPHLVQPLRARPIATTLKISTHRRNMVDLLPTPLSIAPKTGITNPHNASLFSQRSLPYPSSPIQLEYHI